MSTVPQHKFEMPPLHYGDTTRFVDPDRQPQWTLVYPDGRIIYGTPGTWHCYSHVEHVDTIQAYVLNEPAQALLIHRSSSFDVVDLALSPHVPASFFAFSQHGGRLDGLSVWKYTVFGYLLPETRFYVTVLPSHTEVTCEPRDVPFVLL